MARNIDEVIAKLPVARQRKIEKRAEALVQEEMTLQELRRAHKLTQVKMAKTLGVAQKQISEVESRTDMLLSTLRRQIQAMGGDLTLIAQFPNGAAVKVKGFSEI